MSSPAAGLAADLTIFAAASLREAVDAAVERQGQASGVDIAVAYAGSSALARQVEQGAPADIVILANQAWMDVLEQSGAIEAGTRVDLLANSLVLVASGEGTPDPSILTAERVAELVGASRIAMALVEAVPAGIYGAEALTALGLWETLRGQVVQSDNVRTALALVQRGETGFGIVYATDARIGDVTTVGTFPEASHTPIIYPMAIVAGRDRPQVRALYDALRAPQAWPIFAEAGFSRPPAP